MDTMFDFSQFPVSMNSWLIVMFLLFVKGTLILTASALAVYLLRRSSAAARYLAWYTGLVGLLLLPVLSAILPQWQPGFLQGTAQDAPHAVSDPATPMAADPLVAESNIHESDTAAEIPQQTTQADTAEAGVESPGMLSALDFHWSTWVFLAWLTGFLFILGRVGVAHAGAHLLVIRGAAVKDEDWHQLVRETAKRLGVRRSVRLRWSSWTGVPLSIGVWRPTVVLPEIARTWDHRHRRTVLLHELAHVRRRDCLMQLLAQVTCAFHWPNPLVWVAAHKACLEGERATDNMVLSAGIQASTYAEILLEIARSIGSPKKYAVAAFALGRQSTLENRLTAILDPRLCHRTLSRIASFTAVALAACIVLPLAILHPSEAHSASDAGAVETVADSTLTLTDVRVTGIEQIQYDSDFQISIEPISGIHLDKPVEKTVSTTYEDTERADSIWESATGDTLTAEQLRMLRRKYGIDSTYIHEIKKLGYEGLGVEDFIALGDNDIDPDYIRGMQSVGYADLTVKDLVDLITHGIDKNYVRGLQSAGLVKGMLSVEYGDLAIRDYIALAMYDIDPNYVRGLQSAGLTGLTRSELIAMATNNVDPNYVRGMQSLGYADLTIRDYIAMAMSDIDPNYVRGLQSAGLTGLTRSELIAMATNDVDPNYVRGMQSLGYADLTIRDYIAMAMSDIDPNYVRGLQSAGLSDLARSELIAMASFDIDPNYVRGMRDVGYGDLTMNDFIALASYDIDPNYIRGMQAAGLTDLTRSELISLTSYDIDPNYVRGMQAAAVTDLSVAELVELAKKSMRQE